MKTNTGWHLEIHRIFHPLYYGIVLATNFKKFQIPIRADITIN